MKFGDVLSHYEGIVVMYVAEVQSGCTATVQEGPNWPVVTGDNVGYTLSRGSSSAEFWPEHQTCLINAVESMEQVEPNL